MTATLPDFDELNNIRTTLTSMLAEEVDDGTGMVSPRLDRKRYEDTIFALITMGYVYGIEVAGLDLNQDIPASGERMFEVANTPTKGETFRDRINTHIDEYESDPYAPNAQEKLVNQLSVVAETETHRTINTGSMDGAEEYQRRHPNEMVMKTWVTAGDERVRDTHDYLEGATIPLNARFFTYDGDSAMFPGDFMLAENNCGCRCILRYMTK